MRDGEAEDIGKLCPYLEHFSLIDDFLGVTIFNDTMKLLQEMPNVFHLELRVPVKEGCDSDPMVKENLLISEVLELFKGERTRLDSTN